jgi:hypothetical protein
MTVGARGGGVADKMMKADCRSMTSQATRGRANSTASTAREELNEATCTTRNSMRSISYMGSDMFFSAMSKWWSNSKAIAN